MKYGNMKAWRQRARKHLQLIIVDLANRLQG
jgi:hypothetical protein